MDSCSKSNFHPSEVKISSCLLYTSIRVYEELANDYYATKLPEIREIIHFLHEKKALKETENGIDLNPAPTIYAKSNQNSGVEALSLFETFIHDVSVYAFYQKLAYDNAWMDKQMCIRDRR